MSNIKTISIYGTLLFLYIYEFLIINTPAIFSSRKIVFIILIFITFIRGSKKGLYKLKVEFKNEFIKIIGLCIYILGYLLILRIVYPKVNGSNYIISRILYFIAYTIIGSQMIVKYIRDIRIFLKSIIFASIIQSTIVFLQFSFYGFREFLNNTFVNEGNISYLREDRANGLGAEGATLSLLLFCGLFACGYFIIIKKRVTFKLMIIYLYILLSTMLVGRTGLLIGVINFIVILILISDKSIIKTIFSIIKMIIIFIIILFVFIKLTDNIIERDRIDKMFKWATSIFTKGINDKSFIALTSMAIPSLTLETLLGTGIYRGVSALGTISQHDSGYVQSYFAIGLINSIVFYIMYYSFLFNIINKIKNRTSYKYFIWFLIIIIIVEYKEPFIFRYIMSFMIIVCCILINKHEKLKSNFESVKQI